MVCVVMSSLPWSVCEVVLVTVIRVPLFVLDVSILRECKGDDNAGVVAEHEYVDDTHGSGILSSATDMLGMSVVCGMR